MGRSQLDTFFRRKNHFPTLATRIKYTAYEEENHARKKKKRENSETRESPQRKRLVGRFACSPGGASFLGPGVSLGLE
jgi:hypothetical protein